MVEQKTKIEKMTRFVSFRLSPSDLKKLKRLAEVKKTNISDLLRTILTIE